VIDLTKPLPIATHEITSTKRLDIPFEISPINQIIITLCLGTPPQCFPFKLATNQIETFIFSSQNRENGFDVSSSSTYKPSEDKIELNQGNTNLLAVVSEDTLTIPSIDLTLESFTFSLIEQGELNTDTYMGVLGLGKRFEENEFSIISHLFVMDHIDHLLFSLNYNKATDGARGGYLSFGYHDQIEDNKVYKSCTLVEEDEREPSFDVYIDSIIYNFPNDEGNARSFKRRQPAYFSPGANKIFCPANFFRFLRKRILRRELGDGGICYVKDNTSFEYIVCNKEIFNKKLGELKFVFGKWSVGIDLSELFARGKNDEYVLEIYKLPDSYESKWILGYPFLKRYPVVFDLETYSIKIKK
jgi:hypothetical protein